MKNSSQLHKHSLRDWGARALSSLCFLGARQELNWRVLKVPSHPEHRLLCSRRSDSRAIPWPGKVRGKSHKSHKAACRGQTPEKTLGLIPPPESSARSAGLHLFTGLGKQMAVAEFGLSSQAKGCLVVPSGPVCPLGPCLPPQSVEEPWGRVPLQKPSPRRVWSRGAWPLSCSPVLHTLSHGWLSLKRVGLGSWVSTGHLGALTEQSECP